MKKVLMIATCNFLTNHNDGGRQCSYRNYNLLCKVFGKENVFLCIITNDSIEKKSNVVCLPTYSDKVQQILWAIGLRNGYSKRAERAIVQYAQEGEFDYIWFDRSILGSLCNKIQSRATQIVFFHNVEKQYILNKFFHESIGYALTFPAFVWNEKCAVRRADKIICLNERDSRLIQKVYKREADFLLPITFEDTFVENRHQGDFDDEYEKKTLLFVGSYFRPNLEGIEWFINNVMCKLSDIKLIIVGKNMEKMASTWERENVQVVGTVQDVSRYYSIANAVVLPIFYGDGMKVKTAEALMHGKIIFAAKEALEGYEIENQPDIVECNTVEEYINAISIRLSDNKKFCESNRKLFLDKYENKSYEKKLGSFLGV